jgi:hypothetical protein
LRKVRDVYCLLRRLQAFRAMIDLMGRNFENLTNASGIQYFALRRSTSCIRPAQFKSVFHKRKPSILYSSEDSCRHDTLSSEITDAAKNDAYSWCRCCFRPERNRRYLCPTLPKPLADYLPPLFPRQRQNVVDSTWQGSLREWRTTASLVQPRNMQLIATTPPALLHMAP